MTPPLKLINCAGLVGFADAYGKLVDHKTVLALANTAAENASELEREQNRTKASSRPIAACTMLEHGGSFVQALGDCWLKADTDNRARLEAAFPELFDRYAAANLPD